MTKLKLAVVGAGHLGRIHARLITEMNDAELVGVVDPLPAARDKVAADCRTRAFADHRPLLAQVDAAVIATPTQYHHAVALDFLRRGIPLLVEKPLASSVVESDELVQAASRHGALLQVGHIERFNPAFVAARAHVSKPRYVEAVRASGFTGRSADIGVVHDLMIHDIDLLLSLVDAPLRSVSAVGLALLGQPEDVAQARLEFANGCVANLSASRVSFQPTRRQMQIWGAESFAAIDFGVPSASVVHPCRTVLDRQFDFQSLSADEKAGFRDRVFQEVLPVESLTVTPRNALADELRDFVDGIRSGGSPRVTGEHGRQAVAVAAQVLDAIAAHAAQVSRSRPIAPSPILRGPHWTEPRPVRREAG